MFGKKKKIELTMKPLMKRNVISELEGFDFVRYKVYKAKNPLSNLINAIDSKYGISDDYKNLDLSLQYLIDTVRDLSTKKKEINEIWNLCFKTITKNEYSSIQSLNSTVLFALVSITGEARFSKEELGKIDNELNTAVKSTLKYLFESQIEFVDKITQLNAWYYYHYQYIDYFKLSFNVGEIGYIKSIYDNNIAEFEKLKSTSPDTFLSFIETFKILFKVTDFGYRLKFKNFYLKKCIEQIIVAKNTGNYVGYDKLLEDYYSEKFNKWKFVNWLFKNLIGYGEKPWRLVMLFFLFNFLFTLLFTFGYFDFKNIEGGYFERFLIFLSFNNTTMLTVGYGDVFPLGIGARIMVAFLQISGVTISTMAIALFLRKILRF